MTELDATWGKANLFKRTDAGERVASLGPSPVQKYSSIINALKDQPSAVLGTEGQRSARTADTGSGLRETPGSHCAAKGRLIGMSHAQQPRYAGPAGGYARRRRDVGWRRLFGDGGAAQGRGLRCRRRHAAALRSRRGDAPEGCLLCRP